jgi:hypothetical protein
MKRDALNLFEELQAEFPHLVMRIDPEDPHVEVRVHVPCQAGLPVTVHGPAGKSEGIG